MKKKKKREKKSEETASAVRKSDVTIRINCETRARHRALPRYSSPFNVPRVFYARHVCRCKFRDDDRPTDRPTDRSTERNGDRIREFERSPENRGIFISDAATKNRSTRRGSRIR